MRHKPDGLQGSQADAVLVQSSQIGENTSKMGWGGPRANSGGARANSGGARLGAGRPRKPAPIVPSAPILSEPRWFVAATFPQAERLALQSLARMGYNAYLPLIEEYRPDPVIKSHHRVVEAVMWPGYLLVEFERDTPTWRAIATADGIRGLLGETPEKPTPVRKGFVEALQATVDDRRITRMAPDSIATGAPLTLLAGPFADHAGVCVWSTDTRVRLSVEMFGGLRLVTVKRDQVRAR